MLYTTGAGSIVPDPRVANVNAAAAALRNWAMGLSPVYWELHTTGRDQAERLFSL
ncbi:hypothetical protein [Streptomyces sp. NRRL S-455]|uniref:hypothetical protein n=1 Tax=Streptomyces sp. NRRL S-455 TaxID=1463908 RepID=UPI000A819902|nr:hypothetical protein [Streptomyces sp. NRRL S-455]